MDEQHLTVSRTARYCMLGSPGPAVRQVWLVCHGYGQLAARFLQRFHVLEDASRWIVAPEALNRFYLDGGTGPHTAESRVGATWMTREDRLHEIDDYVRYLDALHKQLFMQLPRAGSDLIVLGFSQGVATAARWASRTRASIAQLVLWAGGFPPELEVRPDLFGQAKLTFVTGRADAFASDESRARLRAHLEAGGLAFDEIRFDGGHELDDETLLRLAGSARVRDAMSAPSPQPASG